MQTTIYNVDYDEPSEQWTNGVGLNDLVIGVMAGWLRFPSADSTREFVSRYFPPFSLRFLPVRDGSRFFFDEQETEATISSIAEKQKTV